MSADRQLKHCVWGECACELVYACVLVCVFVGVCGGTCVHFYMRVRIRACGGQVCVRVSDLDKVET